MRTRKLALALPVLVALAATAGYWSQLGWQRQAPPSSSMHTPVSYGPEVRPLLPAVRAEDVTTASGRRLSCDEIRGMDEVEWITDDSYCTENS